MGETRQKKDLRSAASRYSALISFVILLILSVLLKGSMFLSAGNIINILRNNSIIGIVALGMTLIIITGGIDLSVGSELTIIGIVIISVFNRSQSVILAMLTGVVLALFLGLMTGLLIATFRIPAFIVTLGTMTIYRAISQYLLNGGGLRVLGDEAKKYLAISNTLIFGIIPAAVLYWIFAIIIIVMIMSQLPVGRHIYAVGSNDKASGLSGIKVNRVKCIAYMISSVLVCLACIIESSRLGSINSASSGTGYEMDAIAAAVIGGTSMSGGKGTVIGTVLGTMTLGIINNMMNLMGVNSFLVGAVKGFIIIVAVLLQMALNQEKK